MSSFTVSVRIWDCMPVTVSIRCIMADNVIAPLEVGSTGPVMDECPSQARNLAASVELINPISASGFGMPMVFLFAHVQYENEVFSYNHQSRVQWDAHRHNREICFLEKYSLRKPFAFSIRKILCTSILQWICIRVKIRFLKSRSGITVHRECGCQNVSFGASCKSFTCRFRRIWGITDIIVHNIPHVCLCNLCQRFRVFTIHLDSIYFGSKVDIRFTTSCDCDLRLPFPQQVIHERLPKKRVPPSISTLFIQKTSYHVRLCLTI